MATSKTRAYLVFLGIAIALFALMPRVDVAETAYDESEILICMMRSPIVQAERLSVLQRPIAATIIVRKTPVVFHTAGVTVHSHLLLKLLCLSRC